MDERMETRTPTRLKQRGKEKRCIVKKANDKKDAVKMNYIRQATDFIFNSSYNNMKKWRREKRDKKENESARKKQKEYNKTSSIKKILKHLEARLFKQSVRK